VPSSSLDFESNVHTWRRQGLGGPAPDDTVAPPNPNAKELTCTVAGATPRFISPDGAFAIWNAVWEPDGEKPRAVSIKGDLGRVAPGEMLSCKGKWAKHDKHGWSFQVSDYSSALPASASGVATWLETKVDGVGPTFAKAIVAHFGFEHVFDILDADPTKLREVRTEKGRKLPDKQVDKAIEAWSDVKAIRQIETFLFTHGVTANLAGKLYRKYGPDVVTILKENPYRITEMRGIGFKIADKVALSMGCALDDPFRIMAAILFVLDEAESQGHVFLTLQQLSGHTMEALTPPGELQPPPEVRDPQKVVTCATQLIARGRIIVEDDEYVQQRVYNKRMHSMECRLAARVRHLLDTPPKALFAKPTQPQPPAGASADEIEALHLPSDTQWSAVEMVRLHRLSMMTGGPGTGKCLGADSPIFVNGTLMRAEDVWRRYAVEPTWDEEGYWARTREPLLTNSIDCGRITTTEFTRLWKQRIRESGRRVLLDDGTELTLTRSHKLLGTEGWTSDFAPGDTVCLPQRLRWQGHPVAPDLITLMAWQISEGYEEEATLSLTQKDTAVLTRVKECAQQFAAAHNINMNSMPIFPPYGGGRTVSSLQISSTAYRDYLIERGYEWGQRSASKRIPDFIMAADDATISLFLREFFAAESSVSTHQRCVEVSSASHWLMLQLATMLRRFGIWMVIKPKRKRASNGKNGGVVRDYWSGVISGPSLRTFCNHIGIASARKSARLHLICETVSNPHREIMPFREIMSELSSVTGLSRNHFAVTSSYMRGERDISRTKGANILSAVANVIDGSDCEAARPTGQGSHRHRPESFASMDYEALTSLGERMRERIEREIFYATVVSVEDVWLDEDVYDFEVTGPHNYVAAGVLCHNTHTQKTLVDMLTSANKVIKLAAPTGKAARRMQELTGHPASTIHRLLEFSPFEGGFQRNEENPIEADCIFIDETSMLSLELADSLFRAIGEHTHVLLVGDPDQLAPVGAGKVLDDLIRTERVPRVHLAKIFRQAAQSMIIQNSRRINRGLLPYLRKEEAEAALQQNMLNDFFWITRSTPEETAALVLDLVCNRLPRAFDLDPVKDIMVLAPMRDGKVGLHYLNSELERRLNSDANGQPKKPIISRKYKVSGRDVFENICVGSRIVQTKNDYSQNLETMNGEVGIVLEYDEEKKECKLSLDDGLREIWLPVPNMDSFYLAWALTTHKSQGSEFKAVVVPASTAHFRMLNRALYYTAVTRAQELCVMVGETKALSIAVANPDMKKRNSTLAARILDPALSGELF
jgi:ATP-dependent exoDNAse (exonuclease V) alpha subunit